MNRLLALVLVSVSVTGEAPAGEPSGLGLSDLASYRAAVDGKPGGVALPVTFRQLWEHPEDYQGKRVRVEGRVARRFQQGAYGTFPPLVEAWAVSQSGDPFCLVYPASTSEDSKTTNDSGPGAVIRFEGVFLKPLEYQGSDTKRVAPLIVGDRVPQVVSTAKAPVSASPGGLWQVDWALGLVAAGLVALAIARQHLRAPSRNSVGKNLGPDVPPEFDDSAWNGSKS